MRFSTTFRRQPPTSIVLQGLCAIGTLGMIDLVTGYEVSLWLFYGIPIFAVAWLVDKQWGILLSLVSGLVWWWATVASGLPYLNTWQEGWETAIRIGFFIFVAFAAAALKREQDAAAKQIDLLEHSRRLEREIVEISEREQRRIGRDLHDGICQQQAALACAAAVLNADLLKLNLAREARVADELAKRLREAIADTRNLARGLVPVQTEEMGLASALEELASSVSQLLGVDCRVTVDRGAVVADNIAATHLYRIAQEAISNATRHGAADRIVVALQRTEAGTELSISDNGRGMPDREKPNRGMGLNIMSYRAKLAGGELSISQSAAGGTCISCLLPTEKEELERAA